MIHPHAGIARNDRRENLPPILAAKYHRTKTLRYTLSEIKEANPDGDNPGLSKAEAIVQRMADTAEADYHAEAIRYVDALFLTRESWSGTFADINF